MSKGAKRNSRRRSKSAQVRKLHMEALEDRRLLATLPGNGAFDFGTRNSVVETDFTGVRKSDRFDAETGYGWTAGAIYSADRRTGSALERDLNFTRNGEFGVTVPDGEFQVDLILGDLGRYAREKVGVFLEGQQVEEVSTAAHETTALTYTVTVTDGQLNLRLRDLGGRDRYAAIQSLQVTPLDSTPSISIANSSIIEGDSGTKSLRFDLELSVAAEETASVNYVTSHGTADGDDYQSASGSVQFAVGETAAHIEVVINGDNTPEGNEQFTVELSSANNAILANTSATGTIINDDIAKTLTASASPLQFSESAGANASTVTVTRTGDASEPVDVLVNYSGSHASVASQLSFAGGETQASFVVDALDNANYDGNVTAMVGLSAAGYAPTDVTLSIIDDETPPYSQLFDFGTKRSPLAPDAIRVAGTRYVAAAGYGWSEGTIRKSDRKAGTAADRDLNYTDLGTFSVDVANGWYVVTLTLGDHGNRARDNMGVFLEGDQVDNVSTAARSVVNRAYPVQVLDGELTLTLDDLGGRDAYAAIQAMQIQSSAPPQPEISGSDVQRNEGASGSAAWEFSVSLSRTSDDVVTVDYQTVDGLAEAGDDYDSVSGTLQFNPGETSKTVSVNVHGDITPEADESFSVALSNPVNATIKDGEDGEGAGVILNDDVAKEFSLSLDSDSIEESSGQATATLTRLGDPRLPVTVTLGSSDTTAATTPANISLAAGETSTTFIVSAVDDLDIDGTQTTTISASSSGYIRGETTLRVTDDETPPFAGFYDFGTRTSPVSPDFTRVNEQTPYSAASGLGWTTNAPKSSDRGGQPLDRDIVFGKDFSFAVDLPDGEYRVDLLLGETGSRSHDQMQVFLEGVLAHQVSSGSGEIVGVTSIVDVTDGQLTVRFLDGGGRDRNVAVAAMRVFGASVSPADIEPWWPVRDGISGVFSEASSSNGFIVYDVDTAYQTSTNNIRVLLPSDYSEDQLYQVVYVLPVELGNRTQFGDGLTTIRNLGLANQHDVIFVTPSFSQTPWYVDHATRQDIWQETYFREVVIPFVEQEFSVSGSPEDRLLLGFSKSGQGALAMVLRTPDAYGGVAVWDAPIAMDNPNEGWDFLKVLGTRQNYEQNYRVTNLLPAVADDFVGGPVRISLLGYSYNSTRQDHATIDQLMSDLNIPHFYDEGSKRAHVWASGWIPDVVDALLNPPD